MEILGKTVDIWRSQTRKSVPSPESLSIAYDAVIEFFEEVSHHLPLPVLKHALDEIAAIYTIKLSLSQNGGIPCNLENAGYKEKNATLMKKLSKFGATKCLRLASMLFIRPLKRRTIKSTTGMTT